MEVSTKEFKRCDLVKAVGRIDSQTAPQLAAAFKVITDAGRYRIVFDMGDVGFITSAGLRVMIDTQKTCKRCASTEFILLQPIFSPPSSTRWALRADFLLPRVAWLAPDNRRHQAIRTFRPKRGEVMHLLKGNGKARRSGWVAIGLGFVALLQMVIWVGGALFALNRRNEIFNLVSDFALPSGFFAWAIVFFVCGYFLYASILGSIGVLAPNAREGGQFTFVAILPLLIPLWLNYTFTESPDGPVSVFLSLFPLTAPSSMTA